MTAIVSPTSALPRWNNGDGGQGGLNSMSAEEVSRIFMPRKSLQRTNSSSSVTSLSSPSSSTVTVPVSVPQPNGEVPTTNGDQGAWSIKKKPARGLWPSSKAEPVSAITNSRPPAVPTPSSGQSAASNLASMHHPPPLLPTQNRLSTQQQQNGARTEQSPSQSDPPAVLILLPLTGTFERKQISVPYFPDVLRIGRQTNAKTVPTPVNGYFDSKVLSRQHAEVWADRNSKIWIRDVKSSNGTFVNGARLSPENRDSEPHELREQDTLELGIDIVSEDQKSIVHHKVSAKVEHAGIFTSGTSVLDLSFGDIDPTSGSALMGQPMSHGMSQLRGRGTNQVTMAGNGRMTGPPSIMSGATNGIQQRQMNFWMNPITMEQVLKKLTTELKQAKQQSQDLHRTGNFFNTLLTQDSSEELPNSGRQRATAGTNQPNGVASIAPHIEAISPLSQPPAPPPQQPLPEKPDATRFMISDPVGQTLLKNTEGERLRSSLSSPTKSEPPSSQILSLVEALTTARKEIDSQGDRVKQLETLLKRERKARESAEERARRLLAGHTLPDSEQESSEDGTSDPLPRTSDNDSATILGDSGSRVIFASSAPMTPASESARGLYQQTENIDASTTRLQERLDHMIREMDEMKVQLESYKRRAESAEDEKRGLAEMVERIRASNAKTIPTSNGAIISPLKSSACGTMSSVKEETKQDSGLWNGTSSYPSTSISTSSLQHHGEQPNSTLAIEDTDGAKPTTGRQALEQSMVAALQQGSRSWRPAGEGRELAVQSAPYVSMVGVVLIGVGIMTWLNGWQKVDR